MPILPLRCRQFYFDESFGGSVQCCGLSKFWRDAGRDEGESRMVSMLLTLDYQWVLYVLVFTGSKLVRHTAPSGCASAVLCGERCVPCKCCAFLVHFAAGSSEIEIILISFEPVELEINANFWI